MARRRPRITPEQREQAARQAADVYATVRLGLPSAIRLAHQARKVALAAYKAGRDEAEIVAIAKQSLEAIKPLLKRAMAYGRLKGMQRARRGLPFKIQLSTATAYQGATSYLRRMMDLPRDEVARMEAEFDAPVLRIMRDLNGAAEEKLYETLHEMTTDRVHWREGVQRLSDAFDRLGLTPSNSFQLEAIMRTQTAIAYSVGNDDVLRDPAVAEILWGFLYTTVGDDRVRPEHAILEGTKLPKDDAFWRTNTPPNGFACRCQAIPLYKEEEQYRPPDTVTLGSGRVVQAGADPGFQFRFSSLFPASPRGLPR